MGGSSMVGSLARFVSVSTAWWLFSGLLGVESVAGWVGLLWRAVGF